MVDEDLKVWTIDFPQMVSTNHPDANFYFERDQTCIHVIFKRKFNFMYDRRYNLAEIGIVKQLDAEVKASGYDKSVKTDDALEGYLTQARKVENDGELELDQNMDIDEGDQDDMDIEDHEDSMDSDDGEGEIVDDGNEDALGDIDAEMQAMNIDTTATGADVKAGDNVNTTKDDKVDDKDGGDEEDDNDSGIEDVDWEAKQEKRQQMKALKKEKLANKPAKSMMMKLDKPDKQKDGEKDSESEEDEKDLIKRAVKRQFRKKKPIKSNKNHPKQFNAAVRDQMSGYK